MAKGLLFFSVRTVVPKLLSVKEIYSTWGDLTMCLNQFRGFPSLQSYTLSLYFQWNKGHPKVLTTNCCCFSSFNPPNLDYFDNNYPQYIYFFEPHCNQYKLCPRFLELFKTFTSAALQNFPLPAQCAKFKYDQLFQV